MRDVYDTKAIALARVGLFADWLDAMNKCIELFEKMSGKHDDDPYYQHYLHDLAYVYYKSWQFDKAESIIKQVIENCEKYGIDHPNSFEKKLLLGKIYCAQGRLLEAEETVGTLLEEHKNSETYYSYAVILMKGGYIENAIQLVRTCLGRMKHYEPDLHICRKFSRLLDKLENNI